VTIRVAAVLILALALPVGALVVASRDLPDLEMRPAGGTLGAWIGSIEDGSLPRQRFRTPSDGLWRIDVALRQSRAPGGIRLKLLAGDALLRTAIGRPGTVRDLNYAFTTFEFEPLEDSGGRELTFELVPEGNEGLRQFSFAPRLRARRLAGGRPLLAGDPTQTDEARGRFLSTRDGLTALSFFATIVPAGTYRLELTETSGEVVREVEHELPAGHMGGTVLVPFEPIEGSREHVYRWRLEPPPGAHLWLAPTTVDGVEMLTTRPGQYHGPRRDDERLLGASGAGWPDGEGDLLMATFAHGRDPWADLVERMGPRLPAAAALWLGACLTLMLALGRRSRSPDSAPDQNAK